MAKIPGWIITIIGIIVYIVTAYSPFEKVAKIFFTVIAAAFILYGTGSMAIDMSKKRRERAEKQMKQQAAAGIGMHPGYVQEPANMRKQQPVSQFLNQRNPNANQRAPNVPRQQAQAARPGVIGYCSVCGAGARSDDNFCGQCGARLK